MRIAEHLLGTIPELNHGYFAIGSLAPDCGSVNEELGTYDPPAAITHYKQGGLIRDLYFLRDFENELRPTAKDQLRRSFLLGYFLHLIIDQLWVAYVVRSYPEINREIKRDWYGQDFIYVRENPESLFWADFLRSKYRHDYLPQLPRPLISKKLAFIKDTYRRNDEEIQAVFEREYKYFSSEQMNQTLQSIGDQCALIHRLIWQEGVDLRGLESALQLLET